MATKRRPKSDRGSEVRESAKRTKLTRDFDVIRRTPDEKRKERHLRMRLTQEHWELLQCAAEVSLLSISAWARRELVLSAKKVLAQESVRD